MRTVVRVDGGGGVPDVLAVGACMSASGVSSVSELEGRGD
jgi:hypothetical protein